jgi:signal transduction histidine kinase
VLISVFHEVRVPLNTALLAVQNLEGEDVFKQVPEDQAEMVHGLMRSLTTMEKVSSSSSSLRQGKRADRQVLNDVLSFNRMEAGRVSVSSPSRCVYRVSHG